MSNRPSSSSTTHTQPVAPTIPSAIHALAAPPPVLIDDHIPNYLTPCVLEALRQSSSYVVNKRRKAEEDLRKEGFLPNDGHPNGEPRAEEMIEAEMAERMERIGAMVGGYIAEKLTLARPPFANHLDVIKFICKDVFLYVYSKQIDNLRTNHRGVFVLQSHAFPPLTSLSSHRGSSADLEAAKPHLLFPQALIHGALDRLGVQATVTAESSGLPQCTFQIRTIKAPTPSTTTATPATASAPTMASPIVS